MSDKVRHLVNSQDRPIRISEIAVWGSRIFMTFGMALIMYSGTAKINELIDVRIAPIIIKRDLQLEQLTVKLEVLHGDIQKVNSSLETLTAVSAQRERERERERESKGK